MNGFQIARGILRIDADTSSAVAGLKLVTAAATVTGSAVAVLPALLGSVASQGGVLALSFKGVGDALKGYTSDQKASASQSAKSAATELSNARQIRDAKQSIIDAQRKVTAEEISGAKQIQKAKQEQARTERDGAESIAAAREKVVNASASERDAVENLNEAYKEYDTTLRDLKNKVTDLSLSQEDAAIAVKEAELKLADVNLSVTSTDLDKEKASLSLREARQHQVEVTEKLGDASKELAETESKGAVGSDAVVSAQARVAKAHESTESAIESLARTQRDAREADEAASARVTEAQESAAAAQQAAAQGVSSAVEHLADIQAQQAASAETAAASSSKYADAMSKLSPAAQDFVRQLISMKPMVDGLSATAAGAFLPGLTQMLRDSESLFPIFNTNLSQTGHIMGDTATQAGVMFKSPLFQGQLEQMLANGLPLTQALSGGILSLVGGIVQLGAASGPAVAGLSTGLTSLFGGLNGFFQALEPGMAGFGQILQVLLQTVAVFLPVLGQIASLGAQIFGPLLTALFPVIQMVAQFISQLVSGLAPLVPVLTQAFSVLGQMLQQSLATILPALSNLFNSLVLAVVPLIPIFVQMVGAILPPLADVFTQIVNALAPFLPMLGDMIAQIATALLPILPVLVNLFAQVVKALLPLLPPIFQLISALLPPLISLINFLIPIVATLASFFADKLAWVVSNVVVPILNTAIRVVTSLGQIFTWLLNNVVQPVFNGLMSVIRWSWDNVLQPIFTAFTNVVTGLGDTFVRTVDWIRTNWDRIKQIAASPINFVIDYVYNRGIVPTWNGIAGLFGLGQLNPMPLIGYASGGILPGWSPGKDNMLATSPGGLVGLAGGEAIMRPEWTAAAGASYINGANAAARSGGVSGAASFIAQMGLPGFAGGGIVDKIASFTGNLFTEGPIAAVKDLFSDVTGASGQTPGGGPFRDALTSMPSKMIDGVIQKAQDWVDSIFASGGGGGSAANSGQVNAWIAQALGILGYPMNYAGGIYQQIMTESGGNPGVTQHGYTDVNTLSGNLAQGIMQVIPPTFRANMLPGHGDPFNPVDNIIAGSRYAMKRYGPGWFAPGPQHSHGYDLGGIANGVGFMRKDTLEPERVLSPSQTEAFERLVSTLEGGRGVGDVHVHVEQTSGSPAETGRFVALALRTVG